MKAISPLSILLLTAFTIAAQTQTATTLEDLRARAKKLNAHKEILIGYDKFKDRSGVMTKPYTVSMSGGIFKSMTGVGLSVSYGFDGTTFNSEPDTFVLTITTGTNGPGDPGRDRNAYFLIDGKRLQMAPRDRSDHVSGQFYIEAWDYAISRDDLESFARAKTVEMRWGNSTPQALKPELLSRFGKFLSVIG